MKTAFHLVKRASSMLELGPNEERSLDEIIRLKEGSMYVLGRTPGYAMEKILGDNELRDKLVQMVPSVQNHLEFRGIDILPYMPNVSRAQCLIYNSGNAVFAMDLKSKNGTFVNGKKLEKIALLKASDELRIGTMAMRLIQLPNYSKKRALIIGADDKLNLKGVRNDAIGIESLLKARAFKSEDIVKMIFDRNGIDGNEMPTRPAVLNSLQYLIKMQDENSLTFIHYSGHGTEDGSLSLPAQNPILYKFGFFREIEPNELYELIEAIRGYKIVIIDSCHSGKIKKLFENKNIEKTLIICSAKQDQIAREKGGMGQFTRKFLQRVAKYPIINPSDISDNIYFNNQDRTFCGHKIVF